MKHGEGFGEEGVHIYSIIWNDQEYHCDEEFKSLEFYSEQYSPFESFMYYEGAWDYRDMGKYHRALTLMYYAFTTLSTVGFGDYYPVNQQEQVVGAFVMLFGVAAFSYCAGELLVMVENL